MIFGSISYLNLLPFQLFLKRALPSNQIKQAFQYRRDVPSRINRAFQKRAINAAFISSVTSSKCRCSDLGIIADGAVRSVFVLEGEDEIDRESASSNMLAKILKLQGRVLIGDKALRHHLSGGEGIDLAERWKDDTGLPFVFARLCYNGHSSTINSLTKRFTKQPVRIPQTILKKESRAKGIKPQELLWYLEHIHYEMDYKAKRSLKLFLRKSRKARRQASFKPSKS
ncbi:MAG: MqnA/MqnD/SBP family protein [Campylobacterota bacterium]|nr:MqnA/MqnD/SBP family protein [Campylobacterota bacterium]